MYGILFRVEAKPGKRQEWIDHVKWVVEVCKDREPGTLRFEMYPDPNDVDAFFVYEAYENEAGFEAHKQNEPYKRWNSGGREELTANVDIIFYSANTIWTMVE